MVWNLTKPTNSIEYNPNIILDSLSGNFYTLTESPLPSFIPHGTKMQYRGRTQAPDGYYCYVFKLNKNKKVLAGQAYSEFYHSRGISLEENLVIACDNQVWLNPLNFPLGS